VRAPIRGCCRRLSTEHLIRAITQSVGRLGVLDDTLDAMRRPGSVQRAAVGVVGMLAERNRECRTSCMTASDGTWTTV